MEIVLKARVPAGGGGPKAKGCWTSSDRADHECLALHIKKFKYSFVKNGDPAKDF